MTAELLVKLNVQADVQAGEYVAVSGSHSVLGAWDPEKVKAMKPGKSADGSMIWTLQFHVPVDVTSVEYRYLICVRVNSSHEDDLDTVYIIRCWEAGVVSRMLNLKESGRSKQPTDQFGQFEAGALMYVDQGWLLSETEIQLSFYGDPIRLFQRNLMKASYKIKCSLVGLLQLDSSVTQMSNSPFVLAKSFQRPADKDQGIHGVSHCSSDFTIFKLKTHELDQCGIKIDFFSDESDTEASPLNIGFTTILPAQLRACSGMLTLAITNPLGYPVGQATFAYVVCKPCQQLPCNLRHSFTQYWNRQWPPLDIGHRGTGATHCLDINLTSDHSPHENTLASLVRAAQSGADYVEFDVMLSKDKVPVLWHDFRVSILLRKRIKGHHKKYHIPVNELTLAQLQDLRVEYAKSLGHVDHIEADYPEDPNHSFESMPFPELKHAFQVVDPSVGFYVELKYPQAEPDGRLEEGVETVLLERNEYLDPILRVIYEHACGRRVVIASFDADLCILARSKQGRYPVIFLIEDDGPAKPPCYRDVRTQTIPTAISFARCQQFLGLSVNADALVRVEEDLLDKILRANLICFVWGEKANEAQVRQELKARGVHAVCFDGIHNHGKDPSVFRAEHEEQLRPYLAHHSNSNAHAYNGGGCTPVSARSAEDSTNCAKSDSSLDKRMGVNFPA